MRLTELLLGKPSLSAEQMGEVQTQSNTAAVNKLIASLIPGQTIQGEILSKNQNSVKISVGNQMILDAVLERDINLDAGSLLTFQVKNNGKALTLNPLYTNTATDPTVFKALDMAGLPVNERTVEMTNQMMQYGESIDRNHLTRMYRDINQFREYSTEDILDLKQLNIPVTQENLTQLSAYKNLSYQLEGGINDVANSIFEMVDSMVTSGETKQAAAVLLQSLELVEQLDSEGSTDSKTVIENTIESDDKEGTTESRQTEPSVVSKQSPDVEAKLPQNLGAEKAIPEKTAVENTIGEKTVEGRSEAEQTVDSKQPQTARELVRVLRDAIDSENTSTLEHLCREPKTKEILIDKLTEFVKVNPQQVEDKEKIKNLYEKTLRLLDGLEKTLEQAGMKDSNTQNPIRSLSQNIDFLNQLNQTMNFVQLPLRLAGNDAHGDLYVYSSKHNLSDRDGKVSAYLHLDMEHLGPVGVYVTMEHKNVTTDFTLADEETLRFIESHMELLTSRLEKRGYSMQFSLKQDEKAATVSGVEPLLQREDRGTILQEISFDVRA